MKHIIRTVKNVPQGKSIVLVGQDKIEHIINENKKTIQPITTPIKNFVDSFI
ncbi:MAG: hypothetical protein ACLUCH_02915 [Lachnospirales bacterium]